MLASHIDCIKKEIIKYLGYEALSSFGEDLSFMKKDAERLVNKFGISMQNAETLAAFFFLQDIYIQAGIRPSGDVSIDAIYNEAGLNILKDLSDSVIETLPNELKSDIKSARFNSMTIQERIKYIIETNTEVPTDEIDRFLRNAHLGSCRCPRCNEYEFVASVRAADMIPMWKKLLAGAITGGKSAFIPISGSVNVCGNCEYIWES